MMLSLFQECNLLYLSCCPTLPPMSFFADKLCCRLVACGEEHGAAKKEAPISAQ
jgi:hypothetical protein